MISSINKIDVSLTILLNRMSSSSNTIRRGLILLTHSSGGITYVLYALILFYFTDGIGKDILFQGLAAFSYQVPMYVFLKNIIKRSRPFMDHDIKLYINPPDRYSCPSGHCASALLVTLLVSSHLPSLLPMLIIWMTLIYISRVSLGIHYFSDTIAGAALGASSYLVSNLIVSYLL